MLSACRSLLRRNARALSAAASPGIKAFNTPIRLIKKRNCIPLPQKLNRGSSSGEFSCHLTEDLVGIQMTVYSPLDTHTNTFTPYSYPSATNRPFMSRCRLANSRARSSLLPLRRSLNTAVNVLICVLCSVQHDRTGEYPTEIIKQAWELGLVRRCIAECEPNFARARHDVCSCFSVRSTPTSRSSSVALVPPPFRQSVI
jgi:hypothetical protein